MQDVFEKEGSYSLNHAFTPSCEDDASAAIKEARATSKTILCVGQGQSLGLIPRRYDLLLSSRKFDQVIFYEPDETVIRLGSGMLLSTIRTLLEKNNQELPFDPPDFSALSGRSAPATIGGVIAMGLSGPKAVIGGGVRDHLLGSRLIDGQGNVIRTGSRVIKNVTGYDITKLVGGSWGSLGLITEVTLRTTTRPPFTTTLQIPTAYEKAIELTLDMMRTAYAPAATQWLDESCASALSLASGACLLLRFQGSERRCRRSVEVAHTKMKNMMKHDLLEKDVEQKLWQEVKDLKHYQILKTDQELWRITMPASHVHTFLKSVSPFASRISISGAGTCLWLCTMGGEDTLFQSLTTSSSGQGSMMRFRHANHTLADSYRTHDRPQPPRLGSDEVRRELEDRVMAVFDPDQVFSPPPR